MTLLALPTLPVYLDDDETLGQQFTLHAGQINAANYRLLLLLAGVGELYLLWVVAYLVAYPFIARVRQVAEHGNVPDLYNLDPRLNTRTTIPNWVERMIFCPNHVNYHVEHHLLASVPSYRLKALHQALLARGFYEGREDTLARGYWDVIKRAVPQLDRNSPAPA